MIFVHLYNDSSGSPRVLSSVIASLSESRDDHVLFLGSAGDGLLGKLALPIVRYFYPRYSNKWAVLLAYLVSQLCLFMRLLFSSKTRGQDKVYINTVLPFGAAIYGKLTGKRVIYHIHEVSLSPALLFKVLMWFANRLADQQIYVSKAHQQQVGSSHPNQTVLYNSVSKPIYEIAQQIDPPPKDIFTVIMPASLRHFKGVDIFVRLADHFSDKSIQWVLLLNESPESVAEYRVKCKHMTQLAVLDKVDNPAPLYQKAHLVRNLSRIDQWVETFGLTLIEAFSFGLPVIAPPVGGPTEIVQDGVNGFLINSYQTESLIEKINFFFHSPDQYQLFSEQARLASKKYSPLAFSKALKEIINDSEV